LADADQRADVTPFVEFMLSALRDAIREAVATDQAGDQVADQVGALIAVIGTGELGSSELMKTLGLSHRPTFRENYLNPALADGWIERTQPDTSRSPTQRYRLTARGHRWLRQREKG
jgi:3-oxoacyl-(acyl-carrier-protein) synthase